MIRESIDVARPPAEVFAYLDQHERHGEWQGEIVSAEVLTEGPVGVGTRVRNVRKVPGRELVQTYEITAHDPPRQSSFQGIDGPIRPVGTVRVEPLDDSARSRVVLELDLVGHGLFGKLFAPMARRRAAKQVPKDQQALKERLENGAAG